MLPAFKQFKGSASIVYFDRSNANPKRADHASQGGLTFLGKKPKFTTHKRTKISALMHDKFIIPTKGGKERGVLMGSTNFTPEAFTVQANLLHIFASPQMARAYAARHALLAPDPDMKATTKHTGWTKITDVPDSKVRLIFCPEPGKQRVFLDTVVDAVKHAKSSVLFCMFTATDPALLPAIFAAGDSGKLIYGMINSIPDPDAKPAKPKKGKAKGPTPAHQVAVTLYNRSRHERDTLSYDYFDPATAPAGFLPEFRTINVSKFSGGKGPPVAVHIHHKFIVIDGDTPQPDDLHRLGELQQQFGEQERRERAGDQGQHAARASLRRRIHADLRPLPGARAVGAGPSASEGQGHVEEDRGTQARPDHHQDDARRLGEECLHQGHRGLPGADAIAVARAVRAGRVRMTGASSVRR